MIEISTFPHHRSLHLNQDLLVPWLQNQLEDSRENINKWESPGFFPHVKLAGRYTIEPVSFTGMVQFDIDNPDYLKNYSSREDLNWGYPCPRLKVTPLGNLILSKASWSSL